MRRFFNFIKNLLILAIMAAAVVNYHEQIQTFLLEAAGTASTYLEQKGLKSKTLDLSGGIVTESNKKVTKNTTGYRLAKGDGQGLHRGQANRPLQRHGQCHGSLESDGSFYL